jgi:hypothetical protein
VVTNLILPGVTAGTDIVTLKITIDGTETVLAFTTVNAADRIFSGAVHVKTNASNNGFIGSSWSDAAFVGGLAFRQAAACFILEPTTQICKAPCIRFEETLLVEMKSSDVSATTYRDYGAVIYTLDQ